FIQGGMPIANELPRLETPSQEVVLWMMRDTVKGPRDVKTVLTSLAGEGSHTVAKDVFKQWNLSSELKWIHDWRELSKYEAYEIDNAIDAVFVVKDPGDEKTLIAIERLVKSGFKLQPVELGARASKLEYLHTTTIPAKYFGFAPDVPETSLSTYSVS